VAAGALKAQSSLLPLQAPRHAADTTFAATAMPATTASSKTAALAAASSELPPPIFQLETTLQTSKMLALLWVVYVAYDTLVTSLPVSLHVADPR